MKAKTRISQKKRTANSGTAATKIKPKDLKIRPSAKSSAALAQSSLFEITPEEVFKLDDKQLRELVARNAKAKFAAKGFPTEFVTWGGEQRAPDGGVDVRVTSTQEIADAAAFQARIVGYQVKATKMPPSEILKEMRPGGVGCCWFHGHRVWV